MTIPTGNQGGPLSLNSPSPAARWLILGGCLALLAALGWLDYLTGYEMSFFVFYSVPVGLAAWSLGRWPAVGVALAATLTWLLADSLSGAKYSAPFYYYWNSTIHFLAFIINAVTIAKIKNDLDRRQQLAAELEAARRRLATVAALLPACPACGKPREGVYNLDAAFAHSPELADALCPDCRTARASSKPGVSG